MIWSNGLPWSNGLLWANGIIWSNGLGWSNGVLWSNGLLEDGLNDASLALHASKGGLEDDVAREAFRYVVMCALDAHQSVKADINGESAMFEGHVGLAPEWATGACDEECQRWVSACLLASVNHVGEHVPVALDGAHPALHGEEWVTEAFPISEAAFYGNVFAEQPRMYACTFEDGPGLMRTCGSADGEECFITLNGRCDQVCDRAGCVTAGDDRVREVIQVSLAESDEPRCAE